MLMSPESPQGRDAWTRRLPDGLHWILTLATLGLWALVWRNPWRRWVPATLSGCLFFFSFADWDIWPFGLVCLVPLFYVAERAKSAKQAFWWALWAGWVTNFGGFWWITGLLKDFGHLPLPVALGLCLLLTLYQGLSLAALGALVRRFRGARPAWSMLWLAPVLWAGIELVMPFLFPYYLGNSQYSFPAMIQTAELWGPIGVSAVVVAVNGGVYEALDRLWWRRAQAQGVERKRGWVAAGVAGAILAANLVYGFVRIAQVDAQMAQAPKLKIGMVEADIGIWEKENPDKLANNLLIHQALSKKLVEQEKVDLVVWPESSFQSEYVFGQTTPLVDGKPTGRVKQFRGWFPKDMTWVRPSAAPLVSDDAQDVAQGTRIEDRCAVQRGFEAPVLLGGISFRTLTPEELASDPPLKKMNQIVDGKRVKVPRPYRLYNSAILLDEAGRVQGMYDKTYLLAFGEYIPGANYAPWVYDMIPEASEFTPGHEVKTFDFRGHSLGVMICYEDIIPAFGRKLARENPDVIINITNDAWFGKTSEPYLHLALATFRAVETRKWLLRSTNTGVSVFVDATGEIVSQTSIYEAETLAHEVPMMKGGPTLYVMIGDVVGYAGLAGILVLWWLSRRGAPKAAEDERAVAAG